MPETPLRNQYIAAGLAFVGGAFGLHRFYLGQKKLGLLYLLFFWTLIPSFVALIDAVVLMVVSTETFDAHYNRRYLEAQRPVAQLEHRRHPGQVYRGHETNHYQGEAVPVGGRTQSVAQPMTQPIGQVAYDGSTEQSTYRPESAPSQPGQRREEEIARLESLYRRGEITLEAYHDMMKFYA